MFYHVCSLDVLTIDVPDVDGLDVCCDLLWIEQTWLEVQSQCVGSELELVKKQDLSVHVEQIDSEGNGTVPAYQM